MCCHREGINLKKRRKKKRIRKRRKEEKEIFVFLD